MLSMRGRFSLAPRLGSSFLIAPFSTCSATFITAGALASLGTWVDLGAGLILVQCGSEHLFAGIIVTSQASEKRPRIDNITLYCDESSDQVCGDRSTD